MPNIPNYEQWGKLNDYLNAIAVALGTKMEVPRTWADIQKAVRLGLGPDLFPIGTQLAVNHSIYGTHLYDVVAHDYFKSVDNENAHTMTLLCHDIITDIQFDNSEAFYYADAELPVGTYNFTIPIDFGSWPSGTYQFTLTQALPDGGQLSISGVATEALTDLTVQAHPTQGGGSITENCTISVGNGGTSLGVFGEELNHVHRVSYGSDNYKESAIRQFLNSDASAANLWSPQTKFDRHPDWVATTTGFMKGLDSDFLSIIGEVLVPCAANNIYTSPDSTVGKGSKYILTDKFYLASQQEIFGTTIDAIPDDSVLFPYYEGATSADRIKLKDGSSKVWWTRSTDALCAENVQVVRSGGDLSNHNATNSRGCVPACTIL